MSRLAKKQAYDNKLRGLLEEYSKAFLVHADNVGSKQFQEIRAGLRAIDSTILMGKNTLMKRSIRAWCEETGNTEWENIVPLLVGNVGIVFTKGDLCEVRDCILSFKVPAAAKAGAVGQCDVTVPAGSTGMDPSQTTFFQVLNIATKINKGTVEIINDVVVVREGEKVGQSEAALLVKLAMKPFSYGLKVEMVYEEGSIYAPRVLDLSEDDIAKAFGAGLTNVTCVSLGANYPTLAAVPHILMNAYKSVLAIAVETSYTFPLADKVKAYLADPSAFAVAAPAAAAAGGDAPAAAAKVAEPEPEEESDDDMGFSLFD